MSLKKPDIYGLREKHTQRVDGIEDRIRQLIWPWGVFILH